MNLQRPQLKKRPTEVKLKGFVLVSAHGNYVGEDGLLVEYIDDAKVFNSVMIALNFAKAHHYRTGELTAKHHIRK